MLTLPISPENSTRIGESCFSVLEEDGLMVYYSNLEPFDSHDAADRRAMLLRIARLARHNVRRADLQAAFGVGRSTIQRAVNRLRDQGEGAFFDEPARRGPGVFGEVKAREAKRLLAKGTKAAEVARRLGVSRQALNYHRKKGALAGGGAGEDERSLDRGERDGRDRKAPMGRAARNTAERVMASAGALGEAQPRFSEPLAAVAGGGALAALPALLKEGLLERAAEFLSLKKGYYGLASVLLLLALMFMARIRNPEALRHLPPGELGAILGLDRCPEAKTLRRKIGELGGDAQRVRDWQSSLASSWLEADPEACATLSADGHAKVYSGRKGRLKKHFIARQKLCLPASTSYWINALGGKPFLCLHKALDPAMAQALERDILPALERQGALGAEAPDLAAENAGPPALRLVFDREGWSPELFRRLARRGVAVITWHKGFRGDPWPEREFAEFKVPMHGPGGTRDIACRLAERRATLSGGLEVRQVRRLLGGGRQAPLVSTDFHMPIEQLAGALFSRWSQENFFKSMRTEFNLDALAVHRLEELDPGDLVVNPRWRKLDRELRSLRRKLGARRNRAADLGRKGRGESEAAGRLRSEIAALGERCEAVKRERSEARKRIPVAQLDPGEALDALPEGEKLLLDVIRMIAYRAETRMMPAVANSPGRTPRPRKHLKALFRSDADIVPEPGKGILRVRILGTASNGADRAVAGLPGELNATRTIFPATNLRMVYELPGAEAEQAESGPPQILRGQDI